jgi:hypothetical protein
MIHLADCIQGTTYAPAHYDLVDLLDYNFVRDVDAGDYASEGERDAVADHVDWQDTLDGATIAALRDGLHEGLSAAKEGSLSTFRPTTMSYHPAGTEDNLKAGFKMLDEAHRNMLDEALAMKEATPAGTEDNLKAGFKMLDEAHRKMLDQALAMKEATPAGTEDNLKAGIKMLDEALVGGDSSSESECEDESEPFEPTRGWISTLRCTPYAPNPSLTGKCVTLPVSMQIYDLIHAQVKTVEYRGMRPYYHSRVDKFHRGIFTHIKFQLAYVSPQPENPLIRRVTSISIVPVPRGSMYNNCKLGNYECYKFELTVDGGGDGGDGDGDDDVGGSGSVATDEPDVDMTQVMTF